MADTRRAVAATTFYPLTQDSHYTNVPPIIGPQSAVLSSPASPRNPPPPARLSITSIRIMQTDEKIKFLDPAGARDYTAKMRSISVKRDRRIFCKLTVNCHVIRIYFFQNF